MTTIAYNYSDQKIAIDGKITSHNRIDSLTAEKWLVQGDEVWFFAGTLSDYERFVRYVNLVDPDKPKYEIGCSAILVKNGKVFLCGIDDDGCPWRHPLAHNSAIGSGGDWALSAMDFGKTAKQSIEYASMRDVYTGGKITGFDVSRMEFLP